MTLRQTLSRGRPIDEAWRDPALIFGQTCGYPYWKSLRDRVALIATPTYGFEGCEGASTIAAFSSPGVVKRAAGLAIFAGRRAAINARDSNSGANLFRAAIAPLAGGRPFFGQVTVTGAHALSLAALVEDRADIAAIDCVSFALLSRGRPELVERVEVVGRTPSSPSLPFIASAALAAADDCDNPPLPVRDPRRCEPCRGIRRAWTDGSAGAGAAGLRARRANSRTRRSRSAIPNSPDASAG